MPGQNDMRVQLRSLLIAAAVLMAGMPAAPGAPPLASATAQGEIFAEQCRNPPNEYRLLQYGLTMQTLEQYPR